MILHFYNPFTPVLWSFVAFGAIKIIRCDLKFWLKYISSIRPLIPILDISWPSLFTLDWDVYVTCSLLTSSWEAWQPTRYSKHMCKADIDRARKLWLLSWQCELKWPLIRWNIGKLWKKNGILKPRGFLVIRCEVNKWLKLLTWWLKIVYSLILWLYCRGMEKCTYILLTSVSWREQTCDHCVHNGVYLNVFSEFAEFSGKNISLQ